MVGVNFLYIVGLFDFEDINVDYNQFDHFGFEDYFLFGKYYTVVYFQIDFEDYCNLDNFHIDQR